MIKILIFLFLLYGAIQLGYYVVTGEMLLKPKNKNDRKAKRKGRKNNPPQQQNVSYEADYDSVELDEGSQPSPDDPRFTNDEMDEYIRLQREQDEAEDEYWLNKRNEKD